MKKRIVSLSFVMVLVLSFAGCRKDIPTMNEEDSDINSASINEMMGDTDLELEDENTADVLNDLPADVVEEIKDETVETSTSSENTVSAPTPVVEEVSESTPEPHVHQYVESITVQPTCAAAGEKVLTCECGDTKTESVPATGVHNWDALATIVHHDEIGHMEQSQVLVGWTEPHTEYECPICGYRADTPEGISDHQIETTASNGFVFHFDEDGYMLSAYEDDPSNTEKFHMGRTFAYDYPAEPIYETQSKWVVDQEAWDEVVVTGYTCSVCGAIQ